MVPEPLDAATLLAQFQRLPLIARLPSDLPVQELLEIGDALLAAPIPVVTVPMTSAEATATLSEFRQRYGDNLLVGASAIQTCGDLTAAQQAGAQFFGFSTLDATLLRLAREERLLAMTAVATPIQAKFAHLEGCPLVMVAGEAFLQTSPADWRATAVPLIVEANATAPLATYAAAGVTALCLGEALLPSPIWSHAAIITTARRFRQSWEALQR